MKAYQVHARRRADWWALEVPELPGVFSQVRRLDQADGMARDAIGTMLDVDPSSVTVDVQPILDDESLVQAVERLQALRATQEALEAEVQEVAAGTAVRLVEHGYTVRDAGRVMGLSFQRVQQLANRDRPRRRLARQQ